MRNRTEKIVRIGMFTALALIFSYIEFLFPLNTGIPGIKPGLANIIIIFAMYELSVREAAEISLLRIIICGFAFNGVAGMLYSFFGALVSFVIMYVLKKTDKFAIISVSLAGAVSHNVAQIIVAIIILNSKSLMYYLPFLLLSGIISGLIIGELAYIIIKKAKAFKK